LTGWIKLGDKIKKKFEFKDFIQAMGFVNSIAFLAERAKSPSGYRHSME